MQRILVTGATGQQGGAVVDALLERDSEYEILGLTRDVGSPASKQLSKHGVTMVEGDMNDRDSLDATVEGVEAVFCVTNFWTAGYEDQVEQGKNMAEAAAAADVDHFVFSGVASHDRDTGLAHFDSAWEIDRYIQQLDLPNTVLKPVFFFQNLEMMSGDILSGTLAMPLEEGVSLQMIDVADIGRAAARVIGAREDYLGASIDLAGDEKTLEELAAVFSDVIGSSVQPVHLSIDDAREALGAEMAEMYEWFNRVGYSADIASLEDSFGFRFHRLHEYLARTGWSERG